jgi:chemotaxis protein MotB
MLRRALALSFVCGLLTGCGGAEQEAKVAALEAELAESKAAVAAAEAAAAEQEAKVTEIEAAQQKVAELSAKVEELEGSKGALESQLQKKEKALEAVKALQDQLSKSLVAEIEAGEISVSQRGGYLVVDVSDKVLFATGKAELSKRGQKVIGRLAETLKALPEKSVFQVGGHTDDQPIKSEEVLANFPSNWELSAARATNVVRYLEESCEVPGERLVAAGFSQYRPVASNRKGKGRKRNRRIEIALLPPRK